MEKDKITIIGSNGYLGNVLVKLLQKNKKIKIKCYDSNIFKNCYFRKSNKPKLIKKDSRDLVEEELKSSKSIVFLCGIQNDPRNLTFKEIFDPEYIALKNIINICKKYKIKLIFSSSCSVYGKSNRLLCDEESLTNPLTFYSKNKLRMEKLILKNRKDLNAFILRFGTAFGFSEKHRLDIVINMLVAQAMVNKKIILNSDGKSWRPFIHVNDMAKVIIEFIKYKNKIKNNIFNIGYNNNNVQIIKIVNIIRKIIPNVDLVYSNKNEFFKDKHVKNSGKDLRSYKVSFKKFEKIFPHFIFEFSIKKGVIDLIKKYKSLKINQKDISNRKFYRLQKLEYLINKKKINKKLYFL